MQGAIFGYLHAHNLLIESAEFSGVDIVFFYLGTLCDTQSFERISLRNLLPIGCFYAVMIRCDGGATPFCRPSSMIFTFFTFAFLAQHDAGLCFDSPFACWPLMYSFDTLLYTSWQQSMSFFSLLVYYFTRRAWMIGRSTFVRSLSNAMQTLRRPFTNT